jgi:dihydropteroate synthase
MKSINCKGTLIDLSSPKVMGILNITPDSFYDGGRYSEPHKILNQVEKMCSEGATFIDIGGFSSRPGATYISEDEELDRILPVLKILLKEFPSILLSIDTFRSKVAEVCIDQGAALINDISAGTLDKNMFKTMARLQVPYIIMHMQGNSENMQQNPFYNDVVKELIHYFATKLSELRDLGLNDIITDVGFGFGKTLEHNYELLNKLELFQALEVPSLVGLSRKSMLYKPLNIHPSQALNATSSANMIALQKGANILRVHDVKQAMEVIQINQLLNN